MTKKIKASIKAPLEKNAHGHEERDDALTDKLIELAIELRDVDLYATLNDDKTKALAVLRKTVRKCLQNAREQALDEALETVYEKDVKAYHVLRESVEEQAGTILLRRDAGPELEVNAFAVPMFVHTQGGLHTDQCFQDDDAFEQLRASFIEHGLESRHASVVLVSHAYHPDEMDRIGYCHLNAMVQEAADAMTRKKASMADAIVRSLSGWPPSGFAPDDQAVELRFLVGFALKPNDDPFYHVPEKAAAADRYFEARAERFRKWTQQVTPLLQRCLVTDGRDVRIDFLYQDLFHGAREAALIELSVLRVLTEVRDLFETQGNGATDVEAVIGPVDSDEESLLRVNLSRSAGNADLGYAERLLSRTESMESAIDDIADGLTAMGIVEVKIASAFDSEGCPNSVRPYRKR